MAWKTIVMSLLLAFILILSSCANLQGKTTFSLNTTAGKADCSAIVLIENNAVKSSSHCQFEIMKDGRLYQCLIKTKTLNETTIVDIEKECSLII